VQSYTVELHDPKKSIVQPNSRDAQPKQQKQKIANNNNNNNSERFINTHLSIHLSPERYP
jgi:hypothetical protein